MSQRYRFDYVAKIRNHVVIEADSKEHAEEIFDRYDWTPEVTNHIDDVIIVSITREKP